MRWVGQLSSLFYRFGNVMALFLSVLVFALFIAIILPAEAEKSATETGSDRYGLLRHGSEQT